MLLLNELKANIFVWKTYFIYLLAGSKCDPLFDGGPTFSLGIFVCQFTLVQFYFIHLLAFEHTQNKNYIEPAYGQDIFLIEIMKRLITSCWPYWKKMQCGFVYDFSILSCYHSRARFFYALNIFGKFQRNFFY